jgi:hypothetical protein
VGSLHGFCGNRNDPHIAAFYLVTERYIRAGLTGGAVKD